MNDKIWIAIGFGGQALFFSRLIWQWWCSERAGRLVMPLGFVYLSIFGSLILLTYAIHKVDVVFIAGQSVGFIAYMRQFFIARGHSKRLAEPAACRCPHCGEALEE